MADEKPAEVKMTDEKPAEVKMTDEKPAEVKMTDEKPAEVKMTDEKPAEEKMADEKPAEAKIAVEKPAEAKMADEKPAEAKIADEKPAEAKIAVEKPAETKIAVEKPAEAKIAVEKPAEAKIAVEKPAEAKIADEKPAKIEQHPNVVETIPPSPYTVARKASVDKAKLLHEHPEVLPKKKEKKSSVQAVLRFLYDPKRKTLLGRSSLNWAKLAAFYTVFYFCLGCFFVLLLYVFYLILDRHVPRYHNTESTMAVRTEFTVVGMGFRPQPRIDDNLILITDDPGQQEQIAKSLRLFRDVFLVQKSDAKTEVCSDESPASILPQGTACLFNWHHIVDTQNHPCSDTNLYGFKNEEPCVLVKLNKVYGWAPTPGLLPPKIQELRGISNTKTIKDSDVYVTCEGTYIADKALVTDITYYSLETPTGSSKFGIIPNYFFPYQNAPDHVQPFVLVQFKKLPLDVLITVTCKFWAPNVIHDTRTMRGMTSFQLYRTHSNTLSQPF